jgi:hypothetical protein
MRQALSGARTRNLISSKEFGIIVILFVFMQITEGMFDITSILRVYEELLKYLNFLFKISPLLTLMIPLSLTAICLRSTLLKRDSLLI